MNTNGPDATNGTDAMINPRSLDPQQDFLQYGDMSQSDLDQTVRVLTAIRRWQESGQRLSAKSRREMRLNETDMKALRYLVVAKNEHRIVTPGDLAVFLEISTSSTTKLLDRLTDAGHVERSPHPKDRRALAISITDHTHQRVHNTVGRTHARRFDIAAALSPAESAVVVDFLNNLSDANDIASRPSAGPAATGTADTAREGTGRKHHSSN